MQVADHRLGAQHEFAVEFEHEAQYPVGRRMRRAHVDDHGLVVVTLVVDLSRIKGHAVETQHRTNSVVLAQGVTLPVLGHQDSRQVGVPVEEDAKEVEGFALGGLGTGVDVKQGVNARRLVAGLHAHAHALALGERQEIGHDFEPRGRHALGQCTVEVFEVIHTTDVDAHLEAVRFQCVHQVDVLLGGREECRVARESLLDEDGWGGQGRKGDHFGVPILTATGTSGVQIPPAASRWVGVPSCRRFIISPVRICSCSVKIACINVSGLGGQPGA